MADFQHVYFELLRRQVDEEIQFLIGKHHKDTENFTPCMFCYETKGGKFYSCNRLRELRQFQTSIAVNQRQNVGKQGESKPKQLTSWYDQKPIESTHFNLPELMQPL